MPHGLWPCTVAAVAETAASSVKEATLVDDNSDASTKTSNGCAIGELFGILRLGVSGVGNHVPMGEWERVCFEGNLIQALRDLKLLSNLYCLAYVSLVISTPSFSVVMRYFRYGCLFLH